MPKRMFMAKGIYVHYWLYQQVYTTTRVCFTPSQNKFFVLLEANKDYW